MTFKKYKNFAVLVLFLLPLGVSAKSAFEFFMSFNGTNIAVGQNPAYRALVEENTYYDEFSNFRSIAQRCAPNTNLDLLEGIVRTESKFHPFAIGVSRGPYYKDQPQTVQEAVRIMKELDRKRIDYSVGLGQINVRNFKRFGLTHETVLDPCKNLKVAATVLNNCSRIINQKLSAEGKTNAILTCYNTGNYRRSYQSEKAVNSAYARRVKRNQAYNNDDQVLWWPNKDAMEAYADKQMGNQSLTSWVESNVRLSDDSSKSNRKKSIQIYTDKNVASLKYNVSQNSDTIIRRGKDKEIVARMTPNNSSEDISTAEK